MARIIENYRDLIDQVTDYINRTDFSQERIETFIYLAERKIFRRYRAQNNEKTVTYDMKVNPDPQIPTDLPLNDRWGLQGDHLETLTLQANGRPLERISLTQLQTLQFRNTNQEGEATQIRQSEPTHFARERDLIIVFPFPPGDTLFKHIYYCDYSGSMSEDTDDTPFLRVAPDLYIYGACLESEPFLKPEDDEFQMIPIWKQMYEEAFAQIENQVDRELYSGSANEIQSAFSGGRSRNDGRYGRRGWA